MNIWGQSKNNQCPDKKKNQSGRYPMQSEQGHGSVAFFLGGCRVKSCLLLFEGCGVRSLIHDLERF